MHAAADVGLLELVASRTWMPRALAEAAGLDARGVTAVLEVLAALDIVDSTTDGYFLRRPIPDVPTVARHMWSELGSDSAACAFSALHETASLEEPGSQHVWSAAVIELALRGIFAALEDGPRQCGELDVPPALLQAGKRTGFFEIDGDSVRLSVQARKMFGVPDRSQFATWIQGRMRLERDYFWHPLGALGECLRTGQPVTLTSAPGCSGQFRATFTRVNVPLLPVLLGVARRVVDALGGARRPRHVLELGASLGYWGIAFAAAHPDTTILAVDASEALSETQSLVARAGLSSRYTWHADPTPALSRNVCDGPFDVVVLHEICHTLSPQQLDTSLELAKARLAPDGVLLIADMLLDPARTSPRRHVMSGLKLLVTGGGALLDTSSAPQRLAESGFTSVRVQRLPTTDLVLARA